MILTLYKTQSLITLHSKKDIPCVTSVTAGHVLRPLCVLRVLSLIRLDEISLSSLTQKLASAHATDTQSHSPLLSSAPLTSQESQHQPLCPIIATHEGVGAVS